MFKLNLCILLCCVLSFCNGKELHKIVSGLSADLRDYRHHVSIQYAGSHMCGGSIITNHHVITAANCVSFDLVIFPGNLRILAKTNDKLNADKKGMYYNVSYIIYHPEYSPRSFWENDIAILRLETPIIHRGIKSGNIPLIRHGLIQYEILNSCGWEDNFPGTYRPSQYLKKIEMKTENSLYCNGYFRRYVESFDSSRQCATSKDPYAVITRGDGGGGLLSSKKIAGIISAVLISYMKTITYTMILPYLKWINSIIIYY